MDRYAPSPQEVQSNYDYHQGDDRQTGPVVRWTPQDNRYYQNANVRSDGDVNIYAQNVIIENPNRVNAQVWQPVQEAAPVIQRVQYTSDCNTYNNGCYGRNRGDEVASQFFGAVVGGVIGGLIINGGRHHGYDRGWDRGYNRGYDRGWDDRGYYDRGRYDNRYNGGYYNNGGYYGGAHRPMPMPRNCNPNYGRGRCW